MDYRADQKLRLQKVKTYVNEHLIVLLQLSGELGLSAYTFPNTNSRCGREVMQMSVFLALVQTLIGAATLGVALLALEGNDPPKNDGPSKQSEN